MSPRAVFATVNRESVLFVCYYLLLITFTGKFSIFHRLKLLNLKKLENHIPMKTYSLLYYYIVQLFQFFFFFLVFSSEIIKYIRNSHPPDETKRVLEGEFFSIYGKIISKDKLSKMKKNAFQQIQKKKGMLYILHLIII